MARTPLFRSLKTLVAGTESHARMSRREFLSAALALGAVSACSPIPRPGDSRRRIAIVGAGVAGLTAALTLADRGVAATVYESGDRVGGRMRSDRRGFWLDGQTSEWCGELIDTSHKTILSLAQRFRLPIVDLIGAQPARAEETYFFGGSYYPRPEVIRDFTPVHRAIADDLRAAPPPTNHLTTRTNAIALDALTLHDWIESRVPGGHASRMGRLLDVAYTIEFGAETTSQSALNLIYMLGYQPSADGFAIFGGSDERYRIAGGNEQLPEAIAAALPAGTVKLGWRLAAISAMSDGRIALTFEVDGAVSVVIVDHVVLAFHFGVLRTLDTRRAGFDDLKQRAIRELGLGNNAKLHLQFESRHWNRTRPWGTGTAAQRFLAQLDPVYPGITAQWNGRATLSVPALDPGTNCSYSYYKAGQYRAFGGYEGRRQGNIHFAGEHTSIGFQGYMEGGAAEGVRAATEILAELAI